jgi:kynureninase
LAWEDAAADVDGKWQRAFAMADRVRQGFAERLGDPSADIALGASTHELVVRFLSALPLSQRPRLVSTDGEFYSLDRQLRRLEEEGVEVVRIPADEPEKLAERLSKAVNSQTAAVLVSSLLFRSGRIVPGLGQVAKAAEQHGCELLVDAYHAINVAPLHLPQEGLENAFVVGGGYKYCQLGEGNCFLRIPPDCSLRPVVTGWFADFARLEGHSGQGVSYGEGPSRFAGATYDPTAHYRAAAVLDFFAEQGLDQNLLRQISLRQLGLLRSSFDALDLPPGMLRRDRAASPEEVGGFLVLEAGRAEEFCAALWRRGMATDFRGHSLRLGPAPYLSDRQLRDAMQLLGEAARELAG